MDTTSTVLPPDVDRRGRFLSLFVTAVTLEVLFVLARLYVRTFVRGVFGWDDYLIVFALALHVIDTGFAIASLHYGLTRHIYYLSPVELVNTIKWLKGSEAVSILVPVFIKLSVCVSILRIISTVERSVAKTLWVLMVVLTLDGIATFLIQIMACIPLDKLWNPLKEGRCISNNTVTWVFIAYGIVCTITDFVCGIIPTLVLRKLQMDKPTKIGLCCLLGLVLIPGICSILKTVKARSIATSDDVSWVVSDTTLWVALENTTGIIIACLPMLWAPSLAAIQAVSSRMSSLRYFYQSTTNQQSGQQRLGSIELERTPDSIPARMDPLKY